MTRTAIREQNGGVVVALYCEGVILGVTAECQKLKNLLTSLKGANPPSPQTCCQLTGVSAVLLIQCHLLI